MSWHDEVQAHLVQAAVGGYLSDTAAATEPTALACLALTAADEVDAARRGGQWLLDRQQADGALGVTADQDAPCWPTTLAALAWMALWDKTGDARYGEAAARAIERMLALEGKTSARIVEVGHDTTLIGWPWVDGTHSWLEPTAFAVLAMKRTGYAGHPRMQEAVKILMDRQFPTGGCNYGNTYILGQQLEPHVMPTAVVLLSLVDHRASRTVARSATWLIRHWPTIAGLPSRCFAAQALAAFELTPDDLDDQLQAQWSRVSARTPSTYQLALLSLARLGASENPLLPTAWPQPTSEITP
jgi:hypothetical protein